MQPIIPVVRREPFDDSAYVFELKLDGFRGLADTVRGRMLSKNGNRLRRFEPLLEGLPRGSCSTARSWRSTGTGGRCSMTHVRQAGAGRVIPVRS
jgi:hypothetical protein